MVLTSPVPGHCLLFTLLSIYLFRVASKKNKWPDHGVQHKMFSVDNIFRIFEIIIFCFVVAICDLMHAVGATYGLP